VTKDSHGTSRRRRRRISGPDGAAAGSIPGAAGGADGELVRGEAAESDAGRQPPPRRSARTERRSDERGWRDLAGNAPSQVGVSGAVRARDVARPSAAQLAAAEHELEIVRRHWQPPEQRG